MTEVEVTMAGRKIRDAAEARSLLASAERSGLERSEWARQHGIDGRSLQAWRLNLARQEQPKVRFVELVSATPVMVPARYVVHVGGLSVEVDDRFDEATLRRLLSVVASC